MATGLNPSTQRGLLIVLVGPSGVGKSTISRRLEAEMQVSYTVSATTRPKHPGEDDKGKKYDHIDKAEFFKRLDSDQFLEYAQVYGDYYATPKHPALDYLEQSRDVLLEIDVQDYMWKDDSSDADAPWLLEEAFMG